MRSVEKMEVGRPTRVVERVGLLKAVREASLALTGLCPLSDRQPRAALVAR